MRIVADGASDVGQVRSNNEDGFHCGRTVFAVADGLGGHAAGEVASALAIEQVAEAEGADFDSEQAAAAALSEAVQDANRAVLEDARATPEHAGMGTTLTAAVRWVDTLVLAHVGDSRAYLLRHGERLRRLTTDHNAAEEAVQAGYLTREQAARHPERHSLTRVVGLEPDIPVDTPDPVALRPGDRVLLCSDGLTEVVGDDDIAELLAGADDPRAACEALIEATLERGAPDNVTVVVLAAESDE
ncbi:MAG: Stp1/IreP family PP2C-type Ser/Thr phosphatase [Actinomycetota bacterium]|nr:Stp1/IreP family PP2C-type Ser/Thr phosphatase [Actinomycetota bacterium]